MNSVLVLRCLDLNYHVPRGMGKFGGSICEYARVPLDQILEET